MSLLKPPIVARENIFEVSFREEKLSENRVTTEKKEETPSNDRYTIFKSLLDAMIEKRQKKFRWTWLLNRLGVSR
jgi:hypothetical protein